MMKLDDVINEVFTIPKGGMEVNTRLVRDNLIIILTVWDDTTATKWAYYFNSDETPLNYEHCGYGVGCFWVNDGCWDLTFEETFGLWNGTFHRKEEEEVIEYD